MPELLEVIESWGNFKAISEVQKPPNYDVRLQEIRNLLSNSRNLPAHRAEYLIREAMGTSDFPLLFGDVLDRQLLATYKARVPDWKKFTKPGTVKRIYPQVGGYRYAITGGDQVLDLVTEKGEYLASKRKEARYPVYVKKYGRQFDISWESIINDDLDALKDTPARFAMAALRTEARLVSATYVNDIGTHTGGNLYENGVNEDVLELTIANLQATLAAMNSWVDANGEPILCTAKYLVVGPQLEWTARAILTSALQMHVAGPIEDATTIITAFPTANVIAQAGLELIIDPYIPVLDASFGGSWYLFADPANIAAMEADYLVGHERPEICMKDSNKVSLGGGAVSPMDGDFETDNVLYRVRDVFGCNKLDWRATYCQHHA